MRNAEGQIGADRPLYPATQPYAYQMLSVGDGHSIYVEQCGNPDGVPVVILHGGPGGGCSPGMRRFFNPKTYRIILFDQRGCGRSRPHASVEHNTTWHLVADIEQIRETLEIESWIVFGGSWGATLSLIYAQKHPDRVRNLVLRGVFLMTRDELNWFYGGGAARFFPEEWSRFIAPLTEAEREDTIEAYGSHLFGTPEAEQSKYARAWTHWESALATMETKAISPSAPSAYARAFARIENHYFRNLGFLESDGQILKDVGILKDIPGVIVQGRYDMICPPHKAVALHRAWPASQLLIVPNAGHSLSEPGIASSLVTVMDNLV